MSQSTRKLRWRLQLRAILLLAAVWVLLWGELSLINVLYGLALGWLVSVVFWLAPIRYYGAVHVGGLLRLAALWNIPVATNTATADMLISSPLLGGDYRPVRPDLDRPATGDSPLVAALH